MNIKTFKFSNDGVSIEVSFDNETYINATEVYKAFGKSKTAFDNWKTRTLIPYARKLIELGKVSPHYVNSAVNQVVTINDLIVSRKGNFQSKTQGTWFHPKLAVTFARWLDIDFEIWCDDKIAELLSVGVVIMNAEDMKYADLLNSLSDHTAVNSRKFSSVIKTMLELHESLGYNIQKFDDLLSTISKVTDKSDRLRLYEKISKVVEEMYHAGTLDITTRESMRARCDSTRTKIMKSRISRAETKLNRLSFTLTENKETHDKLVAATKELEDVREELAIKNALTLGDVATSYTHLVTLLQFRDDIDIIPALKQVIDKIDELGYKILFQSFLLPKPKFNESNTPDLVGDSLIPGSGRVGAAIWNHESNSFMRLSKFGPTGESYSALELTMRPIEESNTWRAVNKAGTICAIYEAVSNCLVVYALPASKN